MSEFEATRRGFLGSAAAGAALLVVPKRSGGEIVIPDVEARSGEGWKLNGLVQSERDFGNALAIGISFEDRDGEQWRNGFMMRRMANPGHPRQVAQALRSIADHLEWKFE